MVVILNLPLLTLRRKFSVISVDFVTEPGVLQNKHLITRLTNNNGNFTFAAQVKLDFSATDEDGNLLYQSLRYRPKGFKQRRPDGNGGWHWNLHGVRRVLYRLPEVVAAVSENKRVVVVEGEKDVDRLHGEGIVATTNPMGAGKWLQCETSVLDGADVVVLPDNDTAGRDHAVAVAEDLTGRAASVRVLELPDLPAGGDVSDWLNNGCSGDELR